MTPNIGILYTIGNNFSSRLTIWDFYFKIRSCLAQICNQSFKNLPRKVCWKIRPLSSRTKSIVMIVRLRRTILYQDRTLAVARDRHFTAMKIGGHTRLALARRRHLKANGAGPNLSMCSSHQNLAHVVTCSPKLLISHGCFHQRERKRESARKREIEWEKERGTRWGRERDEGGQRREKLAGERCWSSSQEKGIGLREAKERCIPLFSTDWP